MLAILAQADGGDDEPAAFFVIFMMGICGFYLALLLVMIFFLLSLSKSLAECRPHNRTMEPGMVWLNLIPIFFIVWMFITAIRVSESLKNEFADRGRHYRGEDYGQTLGVTTCGLYMAGLIPYCGILFMLAWLVCWIIYWVKIAGYRKELIADGGRYDDDYYEDDDYDNRDERRPRRPRRRRRDDDDDDRDDDRGGKPWDRD